jgi:hypothetical protein
MEQIQQGLQTRLQTGQILRLVGIRHRQSGPEGIANALGCLQRQTIGQGRQDQVQIGTANATGLT